MHSLELLAEEDDEFVMKRTQCAFRELRLARRLGVLGQAARSCYSQDPKNCDGHSLNYPEQSVEKHSMGKRAL